MISVSPLLNFTSRLRFALGGALLLIAMCHVSMILLSTIGITDAISLATSAGATIATCTSLLLTRGIARYPGTESSAYVLPSFLIGYGVLLIVLLISRLGYSRALLLTEFVVTVIWCFGISAVTRRRVLTVGVVPEGGYQKLLDVPQIHTVLLTDSASVDDGRIDAVAADLQYDVSPHWDRYLADCALRGVPVYHTKHLLESVTGKIELQHLSENSFGMLSPISVVMTVKHAIDWLTALGALILLSPLLAAVSVIIQFDSPGGVIFRQQRIGYRGKPFTVYKFRTMTAVHQMDTSALEAAKTQAADQRITRFGSMLRRTRIDELPQILNILRGEMSWIGPRPEARVLSEWYEAELPFYRYRHIVRPGITGWAQVHQGHVSEIAEVRDKLYYDFYYVKHYSLWIDMLIIVRTGLTVVTGFGSR